MTAIASLAALDAARDEARRLVHRRAGKAALRAAAPFGFGHDALADLVQDIEDIFQLGPADKAALAPKMFTSITDVIGAYAPAELGVAAMAALAARLGANPVTRIAGRSFAGRFARRFVGRTVAGRGLLGLAARRAWLIPAALGGGAAASYELIGRRCINQCHAYLRARIGTPAGAAA